MKKLLQEGEYKNGKKAAENGGQDSIEAWRKAFKENKDKKRWKKIKESNSAKDYRKWMLERRPKYLEIKGKKKKIKMIVRFRCCNDRREIDTGTKRKKRLYKNCGWKEETLQHIREDCTTRTELSEENIIMNDEEGLDWMKLVYKIREEINKLDIG